MLEWERSVPAADLTSATMKREAQVDAMRRPRPSSEELLEKTGDVIIRGVSGAFFVSLENTR